MQVCIHKLYLYISFIIFISVLQYSADQAFHKTQQLCSRNSAQKRLFFKVKRTLNSQTPGSLLAVTLLEQELHSVRGSGQWLHCPSLSVCPRLLTARLTSDATYYSHASRFTEQVVVWTPRLWLTRAGLVEVEPERLGEQKSPTQPPIQDVFVNPPALQKPRLDWPEKEGCSPGWPGLTAFHFVNSMGGVWMLCF